MGLAGPLVGRVYDRHGARLLVVPGSIMLFLSLCGFAMLSAATPVWELVVLQTIMMVGLALMFTPLMTDALTTRSALLARQRHSHDPAAGRRCGGYRPVHRGHGQGVRVGWGT
jgi:MFS family permease